MRCNDFDAHIDEMLSGILHPDANQHMRQCERCTSHFRARATVQNGLRQLASAALPGPSHATDRAVMDSYRRLQQRRAAAGRSAPASAPAAQSPRLLTFPSRGPAPARGSRKWLTHAAAAAVLLAAMGSAVHLWHGVPTVNAPSVASAPTASAPPQSASTAAPRHSAVAANLTARRLLQRPAQLLSQPNDSQLNAASPSEAAALLPASSNSPALVAEDVSHGATAPAQANAAPVMHLASSGAISNTAGAAGNTAQSASSTWPGYSNLMYCDPMVCSGPMQVVHIKVPVGQVKPNSGQTVGNDFVNAEVVVGPDGVARAIRVAN